jgi:hypothetical protein
MKAKINRGGGFRGAVSYVLDKGAAETVGGNMSGSTVDELTKEFGITKKLRPDCKNPVWHCSLALPESDRLSAQKWDEISTDFMREMGMDPANYLYTVQRHSDTGFDHIHIVASRIGLDAQLWHGQNDVFLAMKATEKLEQLHHLTLTPGFDSERKNDRKSLTAQEANMGVRTEMKPPRLVCQEAIDTVLQIKSVMSAPEFIRRLAAFGVNAVPSVASTGTMNGFSFEAEGIPFSGSKLGESFKWAQLQKRGIEYVKVRDFEQLADTRRRAGERAAAQLADGADRAALGRDSGPGAELGSITTVGSGPSDSGSQSAVPGSVDAGAGLAGAGGSRPGGEGPAPNFERARARAGDAGDGVDGAENAGAGRDDQDAFSPGQGLEVGHGERRGELQEAAGIAGPADRDSNAFIEADAEPGQSFDAGRSRSATSGVSDVAAADSGSGARSNAGGGWANRFKQNSAAKRLTAERSLGRQSLGAGDRKRAPVADADRVQARSIDPSAYLEAQGFDVKREGKHLSVKQNGDEVYRCTLKPDGHWVTCDKYENGIGDNIALVKELEPGTGFAECVYRLSGAPSVSSVTRPAPAPVVRQPPTMPAQSPEDVQRGREYLRGRGISLETIVEAETAGMLRYSAGGVLFVGMDERGRAQNIMRRSVDASEAVQKRDLRGTDKQHPQMLRGASETVLIVEGGTDALAVIDIARREKRPAPTVLVSGGANVRSFMQTPWVQRVLRLAKKVVVAFERESTPEVQAKTDAAHELQMQRLQEVCTAQVTAWKPPEGIKDTAALNLHHAQEIDAREQAQQQHRAQAQEWARQEVARPAASYPAPGRR